MKSGHAVRPASYFLNWISVAARTCHETPPSVAGARVQFRNRDKHFARPSLHIRFFKRMQAPSVQKTYENNSIDAKGCKKIGDTEDFDFEREWSTCASSKRIGALCDALQKRNHH